MTLFDDLYHLIFPRQEAEKLARNAGIGTAPDPEEMEEQENFMLTLELLHLFGHKVKL